MRELLCGFGITIVALSARIAKASSSSSFSSSSSKPYFTTIIILCGDCTITLTNFHRTGGGIPTGPNKAAIASSLALLLEKLKDTKELQ